jgi:hypothetical protein
MRSSLDPNTRATVVCYGRAEGRDESIPAFTQRLEIALEGRSFISRLALTKREVAVLQQVRTAAVAAPSRSFVTHAGVSLLFPTGLNSHQRSFRPLLDRVAAVAEGILISHLTLDLPPGSIVRPMNARGPFPVHKLFG